ncbi:1,2-phenylacetyl-CoA epoxidase subunit PaaE [Mycobacterium botniense]|uniref:Putative phenylacetic acid degradation protein PaaE/phenylacetate-CoA oxygenase/reductase, PaaK subunit n=1 Tax=Mycobacterium botniense TaxID=84962 RepID=A0A7I9XT61_9MYCO|nr:1,2-phenylacetyl-CoA epoxidase subunit PaaE [Mycobacterium botniense]GFG73199.1 putative phenylacetic acid degradation protein PaaE/phenylacetate-CoA oxygenase/reductase, PaaK subunit [Mycobacterium botniense]
MSTATRARRGAPVFHRLPVAAVQRLCDDAAAITFDVPPALRADFAFSPGQSVTVRKSGTQQRRTYSICAPRGAPLRIGVREVPGGSLSPWLVREVRPGDEVEVAPPAGTFTADPGTAARHLAIAAGSGITPILSITASVLTHPGTHVTLLYGNRSVNSAMFVDELAELKDRFPARLQLVHVLSREARGAELFCGRLDAARLRTLLRRLVPVGAVDHVWLCGPLGMVDAAQQVLRELNVPRERVHRELFFVESVAPPPFRHHDEQLSGPSSRVTIIVDGRVSTHTLPRQLSVLDAAQRVRDDLPFACKGGVCGTCRAKITAGEVEMRRNFALENDEVAAGFVLTCQSFPRSDTLTVDFDA